jgi:hypothetical protein
MDATFHGGSNDTIGGDITDLSQFAERTDLCHQYSLLPEKILSAVLLTPVNSLMPVSTTPAIMFFPGVIDTGQK